MCLGRREKVKKPSVDRKDQHIQCCFEKNMGSSLTTGFEKYILMNHPLPEITLEDIDTSSTFLGKQIAAPFIISPRIQGGHVLLRQKKSGRVKDQPLHQRN